MSAITLSDARAILAQLIEVQKNDPIGALGSVSVNGRTVSYKSADELIKMIEYWRREVTQKELAASGGAPFGRSVATFTR